MTARLSVNLSDSAQPRAAGSVRVTAKRRDGRSVLDDLHQSGSMKALFPQPRHAHLDTVLLNTAGGVTGGDRFDAALRAGPDTHMVITTQAAERAYKAQPGETGRLRTRLTVDAGGRIDWVPQETLLYDGACLDRRLQADLAPGAALLLVEPLVFGRTAMGETIRHARFRDRIDVRRNGEAIFADRVLLDGAIAAHLDRSAIGAGCQAMASVLFVGDRAAPALDAVRGLLPKSAGASLIRDDVLFLRMLAEDGYALRQTLIPVISLFSHLPLPRTWTI